MDSIQYLSVMVGPAASGSLELTLDSYDLDANISLAISVSGISGSEDPNDLAFKIQTQLNTALVQNDYRFAGELYFADQSRTARFDVNRTEHVVSISSQTSFNLSLGASTTGAKLVIEDFPVPATVDEVEKQYLFKGPLQDYAGNTLSEDNLIEKIKIASAALIQYLSNNIVTTTYIDYQICYGTSSVFTRKYPLKDFYIPVIRRPDGYYFAYDSNLISPLGPKAVYGIDKGNYREIAYRYAQDFFHAYEPFDKGNEMMLAYKAGYDRIPHAIKQALVLFMDMIDYDPTTKSYTVEGFTMNKGSAGDVYGYIDKLIGGYKILNV